MRERGRWPQREPARECGRVHRQAANDARVVRCGVRGRVIAAVCGVLGLGLGLPSLLAAVAASDLGNRVPLRTRERVARPCAGERDGWSTLGYIGYLHAGGREAGGRGRRNQRVLPPETSSVDTNTPHRGREEEKGRQGARETSRGLGATTLQSVARALQRAQTAEGGRRQQPAHRIHWKAKASIVPTIHTDTPCCTGM